MLGPFFMLFHPTSARFTTFKMEDSDVRFVPKFRLNKSGKLLLRSTEETNRLKEQHKKRSSSQVIQKLSVEAVEANAVSTVRKHGLNVCDRQLLLGQFVHQHGQYRGQTFQWILENDPGYILYLCRDEESDKNRPKSWTKGDESLTEKLVSYAMMFDEYKRMKIILSTQEEARRKAKEKGDPGVQCVGFGKYYTMTFKELAQSDNKKHKSYCNWLKKKDNIQPGSSMFKFQQYLLSCVKSSDQEITTSSCSTASTTTQSIGDTGAHLHVTIASLDVTDEELAAVDLVINV